MSRSHEALTRFEAPGVQFEATDADDNLFGRERAEQVFSAETGLEPKEFCVRVKEWVDRFSEGAGEDTYDDFTIMQIKVSS